MENVFDAAASLEELTEEVRIWAEARVDAGEPGPAHARAVLSHMIL